MIKAALEWQHMSSPMTKQIQRPVEPPLHPCRMLCREGRLSHHLVTGAGIARNFTLHQNPEVQLLPHRRQPDMKLLAQYAAWNHTIELPMTASHATFCHLPIAHCLQSWPRIRKVPASSMMTGAKMINCKVKYNSNPDAALELFRPRDDSRDRLASTHSAKVVRAISNA
jgi:hypothetical protein